MRRVKIYSDLSKCSELDLPCPDPVSVISLEQRSRWIQDIAEAAASSGATMTEAPLPILTSSFSSLISDRSKYDSTFTTNFNACLEDKALNHLVSLDSPILLVTPDGNCSARALMLGVLISASVAIRKNDVLKSSAQNTLIILYQAAMELEIHYKAGWDKLRLQSGAFIKYGNAVIQLIKAIQNNTILTVQLLQAIQNDRLVLALSDLSHYLLYRAILNGSFADEEAIRISRQHELRRYEVTELLESRVFYSNPDRTLVCRFLNITSRLLIIDDDKLTVGHCYEGLDPEIAQNTSIAFVIILFKEHVNVLLDNRICEHVQFEKTSWQGESFTLNIEPIIRPIKGNAVNAAVIVSPEKPMTTNDETAINTKEALYKQLEAILNTLQNPNHEARFRAFKKNLIQFFHEHEDKTLRDMVWHHLRSSCISKQAQGVFNHPNAEKIRCIRHELTRLYERIKQPVPELWLTKFDYFKHDVDKATPTTISFLDTLIHCITIFPDKTYRDCFNEICDIKVYQTLSSKMRSCHRFFYSDPLYDLIQELLACEPAPQNAQSHPTSCCVLM